MNPLDSPYILYARVLICDRVQRLRKADGSRGASAIEWAIITGLLAFIAITVGGVILLKVNTAGSNIQVGNGTVNGGKP
jgi:Flp pilus assembly pilin Flp